MTERHTDGPRRHLPLVQAVFLLALASCGGDQVDTGTDPVVVASVRIAPASVSMTSLAEVASLTATAFDASGGSVSGASISWSSEDPAVATVTSDGDVTAVDNGTTLVTARAGSAVDSVEIDVHQVTATVQLTADRDSIWELGDTIAISAVALDGNGFETHDGPPTFTSSDEAVLTIDSLGVATGVEDGTAIVTATIAGTSGNTSIVVDERGAIRVVVHEVGGGSDLDGYSVDFRGEHYAAFPDSAVLLRFAPAGVNGFDMTDVAGHCYHRDPDAQVTVTKGDTASIDVVVRCTGRYAYQSWSDGVYRLAYRDEFGVRTILSPDDIVRDLYEWSPDGEWIAYSKLKADGADIYIVRPDGSEEHRLTDRSARNVSPTWSPDGTRIAYRSEEGDSVAGIWVVDATGLNGAEVLPLVPSVALEGPAWSPAADLIAYVAPPIPFGNLRLWTATSSGAANQMIGAATWPLRPSWSSDGARMTVAAATIGTNTWDAVVLDADGGNWTPVATSTQSPLEPAFSPDGSMLTYVLYDGSTYRVFVSGDDGSDPLDLTPTVPTALQPQFAADGSHVIFGGIPDNLGAIMAVDVDGQGMIEIVDDSEGALDPLPRPIG